MITEEECRRRIDNAIGPLLARIDGLIEARDAAEFRAVVAEWAVAGVAAFNVRTTVSNATAMQAGIDLGQEIGRNAGAQLLHRAGLAFKEHAELCRLMRETPPHRDYIAPNIALLSRHYWPRPFHRPELKTGEAST